MFVKLGIFDVLFSQLVQHSDLADLYHWRRICLMMDCLSIHILKISLQHITTRSLDRAKLKSKNEDPWKRIYLMWCSLSQYIPFLFIIVRPVSPSEHRSSDEMPAFSNFSWIKRWIQGQKKAKLKRDVNSKIAWWNYS